MSHGALSRPAAVAWLMRRLRAAPHAPAPPQDMNTAGAAEPSSLADWTIIIQEAVRHGVHLLLAEQGPALSAPNYVMRWLAAETAANARRNALLSAELNAILAAAAQVELIPFKGAHFLLEPRSYPRPEVRPLADLDLLARPAQIADLRRVLKELGYDEEPRTTWKHLSFVKPGNRQMASFSAGDPNNPRRVEIHTALSEDFLGLRLDLTAAAWAHSQPAGAAPARRLPTWLLFLHLAAHASQDVWERKARLLHLADLQRVWQQFTRSEIGIIAGACGAPDRWFEAQGLPLDDHLTAARLGVARLEPRLLLPGLTLLESAFPAALPAGLTTALAAPLQPALRAWLSRLDLAEVSLSNPAPRRLTDNLRWTNGPIERLRALRRLLLPDRYGLLGSRFPRLVSSPFYPLAYPLHLAFLGGWLLRRLRRRGQRADGSLHQRMLDDLARRLTAEAGPPASG